LCLDDLLCCATGFRDLVADLQNGSVKTDVLKWQRPRMIPAIGINRIEKLYDRDDAFEAAKEFLYYTGSNERFPFCIILATPGFGKTHFLSTVIDLCAKGDEKPWSRKFPIGISFNFDSPIMATEPINSKEADQETAIRIFHS
jgi:hypothetical protein